MKKLIPLCLLALSFNMINAQNPCDKMVLLEESCAKNCGPCYFHERDKIRPLYAKNIKKIAMVVYNQAPIGIGTWAQTTKPYYAFYNTFGLGYQAECMVDRTFFPTNYHSQDGPICEGVESEEIAFKQQVAMTYVPVAVDISNTYNTNTRAVSISVTANFCDTASGDLRIYLVLTQDTVKGPSNSVGYAQNAYNSSPIDGYVPVTYPGETGVWLPSYTFINVVKYQASGFFGKAGVIPSNVSAGQSYTENFSFTLPIKNDASELIDIDPKRIQIIAAVVKNGVFKYRQVLNVNKKYLMLNTVSVEESVNNGVEFTVTNPESSSIIIKCAASKSGVGQISLCNVSGEMVKIIDNVEYNQSASSKTIDVSDLSSGIYFVSLRAEGITHTRKIVIVK